MATKKSQKKSSAKVSNKKIPAKKKIAPAKKSKAKIVVKPAKKTVNKKVLSKKTKAKKPEIKKQKVAKKAKAVQKKAVKKVKVVLKKIVKPAKIAKKVDNKAKKKIAPVEAKKKIVNKTKEIAVEKAQKKIEIKPQLPPKPEKKPVSKSQPVSKKSNKNAKAVFKVGEYTVYPSHGVGKIVDIQKSNLLGEEVSCYLMNFEKEKLTIKIPISSAEKIGIRHLITKAQMNEVFVVLRSGVKKLKGMWSRRAQEYETKINSGDIMLLAEVLRDLTRDIEDSERSYSERIIYETAVYRLASEYSMIYGIPYEEAKEKIILIAKDKVNSDGKLPTKDNFDDEFDDEIERPIKGDGDEEDDEEDEEEGEEDEDEDSEDEDYDDDEESPRKKRRK